MKILTELNQKSFSSNHVVAISSQKKYLWSDFLGHVSEARNLVRDIPCPKVALYERDTYRFAVVLFALLSENKQVFLPGENHASVVSSMQADDVQLVGDFQSDGCMQIELVSTESDWKNLALTGELVVFTSGSTGKPKKIVKSLTQVEKELCTLEQHFGEEVNGTATFSTVSHQHFYGLLFSLLWPLCAGRPFWHQPLMDMTLLARNTSFLDASCWVMSPGHLHRLPEDMPWDSCRGKTKAVFSSGGPLQESAALQVFKKLGLYPWEVLGSSETGGIAYRTQESGNKLWEALFGIEVDKTERKTLCVRSPFLPDSSWHETQDLVEFQGKTRFLLGSRADRIVKIEGKRISLSEIEAVIESNPLVQEAHATHLQRRRQIIAALISLTPEGKTALTSDGQTNLNRTLRQFLTNRLPSLGIPRAWRVVPTVPRNSQGKIKTNDMHALFENKQSPIILSEDVSLNACVLELWVDRTCAYFAGHFPETPVLPGIVQVMWAESVGRQYLKFTGSYVGMQAIKFKEIIAPNTLLRLKCSFDAEKNRLHFSYTSAAGTHSEGRLQFQESHE